MKSCRKILVVEVRKSSFFNAFCVSWHWLLEGWVSDANTQNAKPINPPRLHSETSPDCDMPRNTFESNDEVGHYRTWMRLARDGFLVLNKNGVILEWNEAAAALLGVRVSDIAGLRFQSLLANDQEPLFNAFLSQIFDAPLAKRCDLKLKSYVDSSRSVQFHAQRSACGQMCLATLFYNLSAFEEKSHLDAEKKIEAIGLLASGIAHDFNNILCVIDGYAGALMVDRSEDDPLFLPLQEICSASAHGAYLTKQMLSFSKRQVLKPELLDLGKVVRSNFALLSRVIPNSIKLNLTEGDEVCPIWAESGQVAQVILNLVVYAGEIMGDGGGSIDIEITNTQTDAPESQSKSYALLSISTQSEHILSNNLQNDPASKRPEENCVGLLTAKNVLTRLGGKLAESGGSNSGQILNAYFPQIQRMNRVVPPTSEPRQSSKLSSNTLVSSASPKCAANILLVEDNHRIRKLAYQILSENGFHVLSASSAEEALELSRNCTQEIELMVSDVVLPGISGTELAIQIQALRPSIRILMMSGYINQSFSCGDMDGKYLGHIEKPFTASKLLTKVRELLSL